ncbi:MAG: CMP/dCMP kinase [Candidatus Dependentiae bacterium]|nr:CMP/dCMP kinase [Candidatus Dependentiae bacterium]
MIITIDGPTASGKGSIAKAIAAHTGYFYVDTGLLYRAMGYMAAQEYSRDEVDRAMFWAPELVETYKARLAYSYADGAAVVTVDGSDVTAQLRTPEIDWYASHVSSVPMVRIGLRAWQRELGSKYDVVIDGRDCGTVLFPHAPHKFYLTASFEVRVKRAQADKIRQAQGMTPEAIAAAVIMRDLRDLSRPISPLKPADDAIILDTSGLGLEASVALVLSYLL